MVSSLAFVYAQPSTDVPESFLNDFTVPEFSTFDMLIPYFPSELIGNSIKLKSYVRSKRFRTIRDRFGDLRAVDALYIRAVRLTHGNTGMALLYCTLATMDHHIVGIKNPLIDAFVPLTNESWEEFTRRVDNLPSHFYSDSPQHRAGDRDKLQHFFGSAFIANTFESRGAAERVGAFVEWGEDAFILDGAYDRRDMRANRQGRQFGLALIGASDLNAVLPSHLLDVRIAENDNSRNWTPTQEGSMTQTWSPIPQRCGVW